jgi:hypothetical protein
MHKRPGFGGDMLNIVVFLVAVIGILTLIAVLDPSVKHFFLRFLH